MSTLLVEDRGAVRLLTFNRPEARNALIRAAWAEFDAALADASVDANVAVVAVTGAGGSFCAGADLKESRVSRHASMASHPFSACVETLTTFPKPLIAAVDGSAVGGGMTMLLHFDFVLASPAARFRLPFATLGALPEGASSLLLQSFVGARTATRLLLSGDWMEAAEALECGLVTSIVPTEKLLNEALALAERLAGYPREALSASKRLIVDARRDAVMTALSRERAGMFALSRAREQAKP